MTKQGGKTTSNVSLSSFFETQKNPVFLAPMAGVTDRACREVAIQFGADAVFSEMVSIKGLYYNDKKTASLLQCSVQERPLFVQLFGHEPDIFEAVIEKALSFGGDFIDINSGCPAPKIIRNGDGGALMKNPVLFGSIIERVAKRSPVPVTVKIRTGWDDAHINAPALAKIAEQSGAAMITVHGRTVQQGYSGQANWDVIGEVVQAASIPVIGNGDIFNPEDAKRMLKQTGCAGVMLGRGALGNPFLIKRTACLLQTGTLPPPPTDEQRLTVLKEHVARIVQHKGESIGIKEARKHAMWYIKGMRGSAAAKNSITAATTLEQMHQCLSILQ